MRLVKRERNKKLLDIMGMMVRFSNRNIGLMFIRSFINRQENKKEAANEGVSCAQ